ncbi:MAG TPA: serine/threonine protein kinase [Bauldia sp.]|nr:serine/threonine protein kinase [Bauldia sp.]
MSDTIHASVASLRGRGVLIRGRSGSGKSSLLLSLIEHAGATLVADDRVYLVAHDAGLTASPPATIAGQMEIRGVGIVRKPYASSAPVDLVVDLLPLAECPRLPDESEAHAILEGVAVPRIFVAIGAHDGVARVLGALARPEAVVST